MDIVDETKNFPEELGDKIAEALNKILPEFCQDWNVPIPKISYIRKYWISSAPIKIYLYDTKLKSKAEHMAKDGIPYGKIYLNSLREIHFISHEIFEILVNPVFKESFELNGTKYKKEVCDPVTKTFLVNNIPISDWILPSWFGGSAPYNHLNTLSEPFSLDGGYLETL
jgi:hypothetical protein